MTTYGRMLSSGGEAAHPETQSQEEVGALGVPQVSASSPKQRSIPGAGRLTLA